ncbi:MAG: XdhC family protein [Pyrinomonadaceae bacterium]|nr:XdhC family protein [Pyrinomonadaceae bacterium]
MSTANPDDLSRQISATISSILQEGSLAALVTIFEAPAATDTVGAKLLIDASGGRLGALGSYDGGALDDAVAAEAARFLKSREETRVLQVKEFAPELKDWAEAKLLFERIQPEPRLVICGAGHVGASLARMASLLGYHTTLIDDRSEFVAREHFPDARIELVEAQNWSEAVRSAVGAGKGVSVAIVTRGHSEDEECLRAVINLNADYVGLIGSRRRTNIVLQRLRESGATAEALNAVRAPVGLDIGAVTPEEVALAIMAEIVSVRRGGEGQSLSEWRRSK